ncbi:putative efflux protein, MATE family [Clostridium collagenovorans DSM 3089]|uniref:Probable multidrug resistance protein NorM n=1 Tax=Clostridium collagenovorans DSM 3089 TaxID=1121306 RepID=A0A1M5Y405_9CLOT|nr:MATE family efflux transporter [Clostridium collagenovorans]SHI06845.1 putative efflux protein, MATE family [Clostridium collagenovorans DSM 3089]
MNKDLTVGKPEVVLWKFSIPLLGSILFQQLYNIADSLVAGKFIGENALAAVGNSYEITLIYIAFAFGCNIGCSVVVSQLFGAKRLTDLKTAVNTTFISSGVLCLILTILGFLLCPFLLRVINTPSEIFSDSMLYLNIYTGGLIFLFFYNIATGIFSAMGDSKTPFIFLAISSTANIFVDILFVKAFNMGVSGVAWATFLCQGISCVCAVNTIFKRLSKIETEKKGEIFSLRLLKRISAIAIPSILQQSFISIGNIIIQGIINGYGAGVIAGYSAAIKLNNLVITSFSTLGNGMSNFVAQNIGANKMERVKQGFRGGLIMVYVLSIPIIILYFVFGKSMIHIFMNQSTGEAVDTGIKFLRIVAPFYIIASTKLIADGVLRGAGAMKLFMFATFTDLVLRVVLAKLLSGQFGSVGIWCAWPIGWTIATILSVMFYLKGKWKNKVENVVAIE